MRQGKALSRTTVQVIQCDVCGAEFKSDEPGSARAVNSWQFSIKSVRTISGDVCVKCQEAMLSAVENVARLRTSVKRRSRFDEVVDLDKDTSD